MLTRFHKILIAALAVQVVLAVVMLTRDDDTAARKEKPLLAGFDAGKVTRIQVVSSEQGKAPIDLVQRDASWVMASHFDFPVEAKRVTDLVTPLAKMAAAAPIATQPSRHTQLRVGDAAFERKLIVTMGGKDITLFLGGPAGTRRTAVRIGGEDRVFAVTGITASAAGDEPRQWVDTSYVKIPREEIAKVVIQRDAKTVELARDVAPPPAPTGSAGSGASPPAPSGDGWTVAIDGTPVALASSEALDTAAIDGLIGNVATIDLSSPGDPARDAARPTATITIERKPTSATTPAPTILDVIADGSSYWVRQRGVDRAILVDKARLEDVLGVARDKLVKKADPPADVQSSTRGAGSGSPSSPG